MAIARFEQLEVWQAAHELVLEVGKNAQRFPVSRMPSTMYLIIPE
jgi:hypothetical protein